MSITDELMQKMRNSRSCMDSLTPVLQLVITFCTSSRRRRRAGSASGLSKTASHLPDWLSCHAQIMIGLTPAAAMLGLLDRDRQTVRIDSQA